ncbi:hypothetical protein GCM10027162_09120 [Streptomyces incanus]
MSVTLTAVRQGPSLQPAEEIMRDDDNLGTTRVMQGSGAAGQRRDRSHALVSGDGVDVKVISMTSESTGRRVTEGQGSFTAESRA